MAFSTLDSKCLDPFNSCSLDTSPSPIWQAYQDFPSHKTIVSSPEQVPSLNFWFGCFIICCLYPNFRYVLWGVFVRAILFNEQPRGPARTGSTGAYCQALWTENTYGREDWLLQAVLWLTCAHLHMHTRTHMHTDTQMYFRKEKRVVFSYMTDVGIDPKSEACGKFNAKVETRDTREGEIS